MIKVKEKAAVSGSKKRGTAAPSKVVMVRAGLSKTTGVAGAALKEALSPDDPRAGASADVLNGPMARVPLSDGKKPPRKPPAGTVQGGPEKSKGYALLIRGVPLALKPRLERARADLGLRSVNDAVIALLDKGAPK